VVAATTTVTTAPATTFSVKSDSLFNQNKSLQEFLNPKGKDLSPNVTTPIVCAVDVTGSMGNWAKTIWDKLPMFYGQLVTKGYASDCAISFAGVGDSYTDKAPLQVSQFCQGTALDHEIQGLWLEGGGGGQHYESYELCAYYYNQHCDMSNKTGFFFFMGDEGFYPKVKNNHIQAVIGDEVPEDVDSAAIFASLRSKFHVFFIHKPYWDKEIDRKQLAKWKAVVGEDRILELTDPKSIVDIILGAIAIVGRTRTLEQYQMDLTDRGQTPQRIEDVSRCLKIVYDRIDNPTFPPPGSSLHDEVPYFSASPSPAVAPSPSPAPSPFPSGGAVEWPDEFKCPITEEPMEDPVIAMDGNSYERVAISGWIESSGTSPITGMPLSNVLLPNTNLKNLITQFKIKNNL